jgi:hypothetical protein
MDTTPKNRWTDRWGNVYINVQKYSELIALDFASCYRSTTEKSDQLRFPDSCLGDRLEAIWVAWRDADKLRKVWQVG